VSGHSVSEPGAGEFGAAESGNPMSGQGHPPGLWPVLGEGVLARYGNLVLLVSLDSARLVDLLLDLHEQVAGSDGDGRRFTDAVADAVEVHHFPAAGPAKAGPGQEPEPSVLAFGAAGQGLAITLSGSAWVEVTTAHGTQRIEAGQPGMLLRCLLRSEVAAVRGGLDRVEHGAARTDRFSRLDAGTVRASGLSYYAGGAARNVIPRGPAAPPPAPAAPAPVTPAAPPVVFPSDASGLESRPLDTPAQDAPVREARADARPGVDTEFWEPDFESAQERQPPPPGPSDARREATIPPVAAEPVAAEPVGRAESARPAEPVRAVEPFEAVLLVGPGSAADADLPRREPLSKATDLPRGASGYISESPIIQGVYCKNGHFDDPEALFCAVCGISMNQQTLVPRPGQRPPLGVLILDDGSVFQLDGDYVVGREPGLDSSVAGGKARPLRVVDESGIVSRVHARVHLDGWRVLITDLGSANGTRVKLPRQQAEQPLLPQVPVVLAAGSQVDLGGRMFRYESHRGR